MTTSITHLTSKDQLDKLLSSAKPNTLIVIDFHAKWCPPCHAISPYYESLAKSYPSVKFTKCDVDECKPIAQAYRISAMPTFVFIKASQKVDEIKGANRTTLEAAVKRHSGTSPGNHDWGSSGHRLGSETSSSEPVPIPITTQSLQNYFNSLSSHAKIGIGLVLVYILMIYMK